MASIEQTRVQKIKKEAAQNLAQVRFNESLRHGINTAATLYTLTSTTTQPTNAKNGDIYYNAADNNFYVYNGTAWAVDTSTRFKRSGVLFTGPNKDGVDSLYQWKGNKLVEVATGSVEGASPIQSIIYKADTENQYTVTLQDGTTYDITMTIPGGGTGSNGKFIRSITHKSGTTYSIVYTDVETSEITMDLGEVGGFNGVVIDDSAANRVGTVDVTGSVAAGILTLVFKNLKGEPGVGIKEITGPVITGNTTEGQKKKYTIVFDDERKKEFTVKDGSKGSQGERGVGIKDITGPTVSGNTAEGQRKTYTIVYDDNRTKQFTVKDGARGETGIKQGSRRGSVNFTKSLDYGYTTATVDSSRQLYVNLTLPYSSQLYKDVNEPWNSENGVLARSVEGIEDYFVNTDSGILYKRTGGDPATRAGWEEVINLHAVPDQVNWNSTIYLISAKPSVLDNYNPGDLLIVGGTGLAYKVATNDGVKQLTNPIYLRGSLWSCGQNNPNGVVNGYRGDFYMNKEDYYVYRNTSSTYNYEMGGYYGSEWTRELCLRAGGASYTVWGSGDTLPSTTDYTEGDYFLNTSDYYIYKLINGAWAQVIYIRGPQGTRGETGLPGGFSSNQVAEGHRLANGETPRVQITSLNNNNAAKQFRFDFYIPDGEKGERGDKFLVNDVLNSYDELSQLTPEKSDTYYIVNESDLEHNGHLYQWNGTEWLDLGIIAQGATGPQGEAATIEFRNVNTGEAGTEVSIVENAASTSTHRVYDITIPRGYQGETGASAGFAAEQLAAAHKLASDQSPRVEITSANFDDRQKQFKFDFYIPSGIQGERGEKFYVNDRVNTVDDLPANAAKGDAYFVVGDNHIYQWNGEKWVDLGLAQEGPKGTDGTNGRDGRDGEAATFAIVETGTGDAGTNAEVEELADSTAQNRKYRITIPRGADGRNGVDALWYKIPFNGTPNANNYLTPLWEESFNRTPIIGETCFIFDNIGKCYSIKIESSAIAFEKRYYNGLVQSSFSVKGADGTTFTPSVDAEGNLSWTNDGGKTNPATVKIVGKDGKSYLIYNKIVSTTSLDIDSTIILNKQYFNRDPQVGDVLIFAAEHVVEEKTYLVIGEVQSFTTSNASVLIKSSQCISGADGKNGQDGKTPVKGEDYWTVNDKQDIVKDTVEEIKKQGISSKENLVLVYAETVENDDGTTTLNIYDSDSNDFLWITPPNCIIGSIEKDNEQKIYLMKMYGGN